jgi:hypothetical protein
MANRTDGKSKLTPELRQRLAELAAESRGLIYGELRYPEWGTSFAEIESDAKELGHEYIRLLMEQTSDEQSRNMPAAALTSASGEMADLIGTKPRTLETASGQVSWQEPVGYLPKSRKAFFPSDPSLGVGR